MEHTKHLWRLAVLLLLAFAAVLVVRHMLVPESFGEAGPYRYEALDGLWARTPAHGGQAACAECHDTEADAKAGGAHAKVQCEVCHDTLARHVQDDEWTAEMPIHREAANCGLCHFDQPARPDFMPVIVLAEHLDIEPGQQPPEGACLECHDAHDPTP